MPRPTGCAGYAAGCICPSCSAIATAIARRRSSCAACRGDADLCNDGQPNGDRLRGCAAWTAAGAIAPVTVVAPRQPWQPRAAA